MSQLLKTRNERVIEAIGVLRNLLTVGFYTSESGYIMTKQVLDDWIADGEDRIEEIPFHRAMRVGHLTLPRLASNKVTFILKATDQLKEQFEGQRGQEETV
jgi:hypothetical protein